MVLCSFQCRLCEGYRSEDAKDRPVENVSMYLPFRCLDVWEFRFVEGRSDALDLEIDDQPLAQTLYSSVAEVLWID